MRPAAVVMNMFYTGLGIARSLGEQGIRVIGLTAQRGIYGNYTRYAEIVFSPDSRNDPQGLLQFLLKLGEQAGVGSVLFPTRDDDVLFLDRFRVQLDPYFSLVVPPKQAVSACLDKWQTYLCASKAGVPAPKCWLIEGDDDLSRAAAEVTYPCVLKPVSAHNWRRRGNWELVGGRKAVEVPSRDQLLAEYGAISRADKRALLQEMVPGGDDCLVVVGCYVDRHLHWAASFNAQKLLQDPPGFGTGCILQTANLPELTGPTMRLLQEMQFSGIAEVEYKWDPALGVHKLIEVNARPWDQHSLGRACGADLIYLAYCDHAGLPMPAVRVKNSTWKWVADDGFVMAACRAFGRRDGRLRTLFRLSRGRKVHGIWSVKDPLPLLIYFSTRLFPQLAGAGFKRLWSRITPRTPEHACAAKGESTI
jgi:D-aspartate ligase